MIGLITDDAFENGYYEQATKMSRVALTVVTSLGVVMIPRIGFMFSQKNIEAVRQSMYRSYRFVWMLGIPLTLGLIAVSQNFVPWFYGKGFDKVIPLLSVLSLLIIAIGINNVTGVQYLISTKRQNTFTFTVIIGAIFNFLLNIYFIYYWKSIGAAVASVVAETIIAILQLIIVRKELSSKEILKCGIHYYLAGLIMFAVLLFIRDNFEPSVINTAMLVSIGAAVYFTVLIIQKDDFLLSNFTKFTAKFFKKD